MKFLILMMAVVIGQNTFAAIPNNKDLSKTVLATAAEVLTLPESLRKSHVQGREDELYPQMIKIAFSNKQTVEIRWKALTMAAHLKKQSSVADLKKALESSDWFMRNAALLSLQSVSETEGRNAATALLTDKALVVRSAAVEVLGPLMDQEIRDLFWEEMDAKYNFRQKQSLWIREQLLGYLAKSPVIAEKPLFENLSKSSPAAMKTLAKNALTQLK